MEVAIRVCLFAGAPRVAGWWHLLLVLVILECMQHLHSLALHSLRAVCRVYIGAHKLRTATCMNAHCDMCTAVGQEAG